MNWSYQSAASPEVDDYAIFPSAVAEAPSQAIAASEKQPKRASRKARGPEFYKPFHLLLLIYLFFYCSRIPEMVPYLHIGMLLQPMLLIGMIMTGTTKVLLRSDIGRMMTLFTIWVTIGVPFSVWRYGSYQTWLLAVQALALMFFMTAFLQTTEDCYRTIYTMALAVAAVGVLTVFTGAGSKLGDPRIALGSGHDTLSDANLLALYLVVGFPALWFAASWKKGIVKIGLIVMVLPVLAALGRTGSRMGLLAIGIGSLFFLLHAKATQKIALVLGGIVCLALAVLLLPERITQRFTTYFQASSSATVEAEQSTEARKTMLFRSIAVTMEHPFLGVGPGEFMDAEAKEARAANKKALWRYTHNAYTELSSETGIPGLVLFLIAFYKSFRGLSKYRDRYPKARVRQAALCIQLMVVVSAVSAFFLSIAYSGILYAVMGLAAAFQLAAEKEYKQLKSAV